MLTPAPTPAERLAATIAMLCQAAAARTAPRLGRWRLEGKLVLLIWRRLRRLAAGFARLAALHAAGTLKPPRPARPRPPRATELPAPPRPPGSSTRGPARHLPRGHAWLVRLVPAAPAAASQLRHLLADPEMAALAAAAPRAGRFLRPLCWMLGVDLPPWLARPPRPRPPRRPPEAAPPDPVAPPAPAARPLRPLHPRFRPPRWLRAGRGPPPQWA